MTKKMKELYFLFSYSLISVIPINLSAQIPEKIKIGIMTSLTGGADAFAADAKNALIFANKKFFNNKYEFVIQDDHCSGKEGVAAANRLANKDKVKYVLGTVCNEPLLITAPIYDKAKVIVIASGATVNDRQSIGEYSFRLFPSDVKAIEKIYPFIAKQHKHLAILTQQDAFTVLVENAFQKLNAQQKLLPHITSEFENPTATDFRSTILRLKSSGADAFFPNFTGDIGYIEAVKEAREIGWNLPIYAAYWPGSVTSMKLLGKLNEGVTFVNLPNLEDSLVEDGKNIYSEFVSEYGQPLSISMAVAFAIESLRILDKAINSGQPVEKYLKETTFSTMIGNLGFDQYGAVKGVNFQIQRIQDGKIVVVE